MSRFSGPFARGLGCAQVPSLVRLGCYLLSNRSERVQSQRRVRMSMGRVIAILASGFVLAACSMSMPSMDFFKSGPASDVLRVECISCQPKMSGPGRPCVKTHTSTKCKKYNSPTRYFDSHDAQLLHDILRARRAAEFSHDLGVRAGQTGHETTACQGQAG